MRAHRARLRSALTAICGVTLILSILCPQIAEARNKRQRTHSNKATALSAKAIAQGLAAAGSTSALIGAASLAARAKNSRPAAIAFGVQSGQDGETTRLVFDLSNAITSSAFVLAEPDRVIVDLPEVNFQIDPARGKALGKTGLVSSFRFGRFAPGKSRIVIDLAGPALVRRVVAEKTGADDTARLVIELAPTDRDSFVSAAAFAAKAETDAAEARRKLQTPRSVVSTRPVIVLDPGHGGIDGGANGVAGSVEKTIVFDFARVLAQKLEASKRYRVILTRDSDVFVSLGDRMRLARDHHAALFISLHADSLSDSGDVTGATVYTVSERASDAEAARVAEKENGADLAGGVAAKEDASDVADILFDLTRRETRAYGHVFARGLLGEWKNAARLNKNPERSAGFRVLKAPDVPSVLLELGYLSSEKDARALMSAPWQDKAAISVARAVDVFFAPRLTSNDETPAAGIDPIATGSIRTGPAPGDAPAPEPAR